MGSNRPRNRLSTILSPSTLFTASHANSRPISLDPAPPKHEGGSRPMQVKRQKRSSHIFLFPPTASPLLPGLTILKVPPSASPRISAEPIPPMSRPPRERPPRERSPRTENSFPHHSPRNVWRPTTEPPQPKRPSENTYSPTPVSSHDIRGSPRIPRNRAVLKHRASVDVTPSLNRITLPGGVEPREVTVSRSQSLRTNGKGLVTIAGGAQDGEIGLRGIQPLPEPLTEKQRVMNVRRARKMQQVFGSDPPHALFQATNVLPKPDEGRDHTEESYKRDSMSSISTANLLSSSSLSRRQRTTSASSMTMASTPPLTPLTPLTPTSPVLPQLETLASSLPRLELSFTSNPPTTAPPFSNMFPEGSQTSTAIPEASRNLVRTETTGGRMERDFRQRRMRAAKLSKFFGVGYQDLEPHLAPKSRTAPQRLEVAIDDGGGLFWDRPEVRSLEMKDVIVRLRDLRSS